MVWMRACLKKLIFNNANLCSNKICTQAPVQWERWHSIRSICSMDTQFHSSSLECYLYKMKRNSDERQKKARNNGRFVCLMFHFPLICVGAKACARAFLYLWGDFGTSLAGSISHSSFAKYIKERAQRGIFRWKKTPYNDRPFYTEACAIHVCSYMNSNKQRAKLEMWRVQISQTIKAKCSQELTGKTSKHLHTWNTFMEMT